jgi:large subunit ribosomal protein L23
MAKKAIITKKGLKAEDQLIKGPIMTEKASLLSNQNAYTFEIGSEATKLIIRAEVLARYKVKPTKINIISLPKTRVFVRGKIGVTSGIKKAIVFLKKGDTIKLA